MINQKCSLPSHNVQWVPIDIRFEENVSDEIEAVTVCLRQVAECDLLFHIQGERYGTIPNVLYRGVYPPKGLEFLKNFEEKSLSITEAEVRAAMTFKKPIVSISCDEISHSKSKKMQNDMQKYENTIGTTSKCDLKDLEKFSAVVFDAFENSELYVTLEKASEKKSPSHAVTDNIIGRKLLLDKASNSVFHSQVTCIYGQEKMGKTSLMKYVFNKVGFQTIKSVSDWLSYHREHQFENLSKEKSKGRMVAWYECSPGQDTMEMLDDIREQLGIRIQPGKDKSNINTSLPKGKTFRDPVLPNPH